MSEIQFQYRCPNCHAVDDFETTIETPVIYTIDGEGDIVDEQVRGEDPEEWPELADMVCQSCNYEAQIRHFVIKTTIVKGLPMVVK